MLVIILLGSISGRVNAQCGTPNGSGSSSGCNGGAVTMTVTNQGVPTDITNVRHRWYTVSSGGSYFTETTAVEQGPGTQVWVSSYSTALSTATTYYVSSFCSGVESTGRRAVSWSPTPAGSLTISTGGVPPYLCIGDPITLTPGGGSSYSWSSSPAGASGSGSITVTPSVNTTYTLSGIESVCGTSTSTSLTINVSPKVGQVSVPSGTTSFCQGAYATSAYTASASDAYSYTWNLSPASAGSISSSGLVTWTSSFNGVATVTVTAYSGTNCNYTTQASQTVTVNPIPGTPTVSNVTAAFGSTVTLTASGAAPGDTYRWRDPQDAVISNVINTQGLTSPATTYTVSGYNSTTLCETPANLRASQTLNLYLDPPPAPTISTNACGPKTLTLPAPPSGVTYYWEGTDANGQSTSTPISPSYTLTTSGTFYIRAKANSMTLWSVATSSTVTIISPQAPAVPTVSTNVCGPKTLTRGTPSDGSAWYWQGTNPSGEDQSATASASTYQAAAPGIANYYIRSSLSGCWSPATAVSVAVNNPLPPDIPIVPYATCGDKTLTKGAPPPGVGWYWQGTNPAGQDYTSAIATASGYTPATTGTYYLAARDAYNCWSYRSVFAGIDPDDITVSSYDPVNTLLQATHSVTLSPGFFVPAGSVFTARIAITPECNDHVNWTESIVYNEFATPIATSRTYYDGAGKSLMSAFKDQLSKKILASQAMYDIYGLPVASTLAAPILEADFLYKRNFVRNTDNLPYAAGDFDLRTATGAAGEINNPKPVGKQPGTLGWYYSTNNNLEPLTPVTDFPYARSYTPEGPNPTTTKTAGAGDAHRMGSNHEVISEKQLIGATDLSHYLSLRSQIVPSSSLPVTGYKFITTDADGKKVVSFVDADGRGLASATLTAGNFDNWSYSYYNDIGQLVASVAPNGVNTGSTAYPQFVTLYKYDQLGRLIETTSPDEGTSRFVYSTDGKIRFSQNQEQYNATPQRFSYTNYDYLGRLVESGEYTSSTGSYIFEPHTTSIPASNSILNIVDVVGQTTGISKRIAAQQSYCSDYTFIEYDRQALDFPETAPVFQQNLDGQVAKTENENSITWYSYDEFGQVTETWQKIIKASIANPPVIKTVEYTYDYFGNVTEVAYQKNTAADRFYHHYVYDLNNRLIEVSTSKDGTTKKLQAQYQYYLHGPLKKVILANNLQGIDYTYTINGSLKTINHADPAKDPGADGTDVFGETLQYFDGDYQGAGYSAGTQTVPGYDNQFGGLLKATSWHSPADKNQMRTYAYQYDSRNQLTNAIWGSMTGTAGTYGFSPALLERHREAANIYDKNGNIQSLTRKGNEGNTLANYGYVYESNTNKLDKVNHNAALLIDYTYNAIGQMTKQDEGPSKIFNISYNAYGLVKEVKDNSNQLIQSYHYDDRGDLLQKVLYNAGVPQKYTTYISDVSGNVLAVYEQTGTTTLASAPAEVPVYGSGRLAVHKPAINTYFYEVNDHLGNVRAVIGIADTEQMNATMESEVSEEPPFTNIAARRVSFAPPGTGAGNEMVRMNSNFPAGPGISLKVSPGDVVSFSSDAYYEAGVVRDYFASSSTLINAIAGIFGGVSGGAGEAGKIYDGINGGFGSLFAGSGGGVPPDPDDNNNPPYAYMTYMVFDVNMIFRYGGYQGVSSAANLAIERLNALPAITIDEPGFIYIFLYNRSESVNWVYFDNLFVTHQHSPIVAGGDYYPFGLAMEGREITDEPYRYGYQGQFSEKDLTSDWNEFEVRDYDARIGRWLSLDEVDRFPSRYSAMGNNPTIYGDPDGRDIILLNDAQGATLGAGHSALLIGDDENGWVFISKEGRRKDLPLWKSNDVMGGPALPPAEREYDSFEDFLNDKKFSHYERGLRFKTTREQDLAAIEMAKKDARSWYNFRYSNCGHTCGKTLEDAGFKRYYIGPGDDLFTPNESFERYKSFLHQYKGAVDTTPIIKQARDQQLLRGALQVGAAITRGLLVGKAIITTPRFVPTSIF